MNLSLRRTSKTTEAVLGVLAVDGSFECYTLEDPDGAGDRIDAGTYNVIADFSNRFQKIMPHVVGSEAIDNRGIRIHCGNTQADTEGCILLGQSEGVNEIEGSRLAFNAFYLKLEAALARGETVSLVVSDQTEPTHSENQCRVSPSPASRPDTSPSLVTWLLGIVSSLTAKS